MTRDHVVRVTKSERAFLKEVRRQMESGEHGVEYARAVARLQFLEAESASVRAEIARLDRLLEVAQMRELEESGVPVK